MQQLIAGVVLIIVVGAGAFLYRNMMERPAAPTDNEPVACTADAKLCPDGSAVGRQGPNCEFSACPPPNVEVAEARIGFVLPAGYTQTMRGTATQETLRIFTKPTLSSSVQHSISVKRYPVPAGKTAEQVILDNTRYQPADMNAENFSRFTTKTIGGNTFRVTVIERFEAIIESSYFLARGSEVLRFDIVEHDVTNWMEPNLVVSNLPEHKALETMLASLKLYE
ncbi:MAG TPA: hypothetical protein VEA36_01875 [Candidatus Paceibacterota bacterium]|nr:hypothetical protein [Candidatus Paceibacterota bacterium]